MKKAYFVLLVASLSFTIKADSLTISKAEATALKKNYNLNASEYNKLSGVWQRNSAIASYLPQVSLTTSYLRSERAIVSTFDPSTPPSQVPIGATSFGVSGNGWSHQFDITQPITNGGSEIVAIFLAQNNLEALKARIEVSRQDAILQVRSSYLNALVAREAMRIDSTGIEWARKNVEISKIRLGSGVSPPTDVLRWEAQVQERSRRYLESKVSFLSAMNTLFFAMGMRTQAISFDTIHLQSITAINLDCTEQDVNQAPATDNPSYRATKAGSDIVRYQSILTLTQYLPKVNAFFRLDWPATTSLFPDEESKWSTGLIFTIPLFAGFANYANYRSSRYSYLQSKENANAALHQIEASISQAKASFDASIEGLDAAAKNNELNSKALDAMEQRYRAGLASQVELLDTRISAEQAENGYYSALALACIRKFEYLRSMGQLEALE